jgi:hypothetical protein
MPASVALVAACVALVADAEALCPAAVALFAAVVALLDACDAEPAELVALVADWLALVDADAALVCASTECCSDEFLLSRDCPA